MAAVIGALRAELSANIAKFTSDMGKASGEVASFANRFERIGTRLSNVGNIMSVGITAPFLALVATAIPAATEAAQASGQVEAALASMGDAAGRTKEQLDSAAEALMRTSTFDDDEILQKVTANLLTFGNVAGEQFDRAQQAAVDLASRLGTDLQSATLLVGKALNDPAKGMAALRRVGIQLTAQQQEQVKAFVAAGDAASAQGIILGELERQFGGSAQAMRDATPGQDLKNAWDSFQEVIGGFVLNVLPPLTDFLAKVLDGFNDLSPGMQQVAMIGAAVVAALGPVLSVVGALMTAMAAAAPVFAGVSATIAGAGGLTAVLGGLAAAFLPVVAVIAAVVAAFLLFKDDLIPVFNAFREKVVEVLGPKFIALMDTVKAALTELWEGPFGQAVRVVIDMLGQFYAAYFSILGEGLIRIISAAIDIIGGLFNHVVNVVRLIAAVLRGDWSAAWEAAVAIVRNIATTVLNVIESLVPGATDAMRRLHDGVKRWLQERLGAVFEWTSDKIKAVGDAFFELYDRVVGHSYIPDMVRGVAEWMAKLDGGMVVPARRATREAADAFRDLRGDVERIMESLLTESERQMREVAQNVATMQRAIREGVVDAETGQAAIAALQREEITPYTAADITPINEADPFPEIREWWERNRREAEEAAEESAEAFGDAFADTVERVFDGDIKGLLTDFLRGLSRDMLKDVGKGLYSLFKEHFGDGDLASIFNGLFSGGSGGGIGGALRGAISSVFGGFRADGGPTMNGKSYIVGERGPELFTPGSSGMVTANGAWGGGTTVYLDARGAGQSELSEIRRIMTEFDEGFNERSWAATNEGFARDRISPPSFAG